MSFLFDKFAFLYDSFMHNTGLASEAKLIEHIGNVSNKSIADIGGGTGSLSALLADSGADVTIIDPSVSMTSIAKKKNSRITVINAAAEDIPVADCTFDIVCMKDCLHHIVDREKGLSEAVRILKPNGKIVIMEFNPRSFKSKLIFLFERMCLERTKLVCPEVLKKSLHSKGIRGQIFFLNNLEYIYVGCKGGTN